MIVFKLSRIELNNANACGNESARVRRYPTVSVDIQCTWGERYGMCIPGRGGSILSLVQNAARCGCGGKIEWDSRSRIPH